MPARMTVKVYDLPDDVGALLVLWGSITEAERLELEALRQEYEDAQVKHHPKAKELVTRMSNEFQARAETLLKARQPPR